MNLNKITTDAISLYAKTDLFKNMDNTIIYLSYSNYLLLKKLIIEGVNSAISEEVKAIELKIMKELIDFVNVNDSLLNGDFLQSDPLPYINSKNIFIAIQKDVKKISEAVENIRPDYLTEEENDTLYTALLESTEVLTLNKGLLDPINDFEIPIFAIDIANK